MFYTSNSSSIITSAMRSLDPDEPPQYKRLVHRRTNQIWFADQVMQIPSALNR